MQIVTFDPLGVTQHANHIAINAAVRYANAANELLPKG